MSVLRTELDDQRQPHSPLTIIYYHLIKCNETRNGSTIDFRIVPLT